MAKKLDRLSCTLGKLLKARGLEGRLSEYRILGHWEQAVGAVIARHARPATVRGGKLFLTVDSPAWMQQLSMLKPQLIEKVNRGLGGETIKDIALNLGEIESAEERPADQARTRTPLNAEERDRIDQIVQGIADPETRDALRRLIEKDFQSRKETGNRRSSK